IFEDAPYREYHGHTRDILDLSWSKHDFLLSSSMDKTVRLWHISRQECLCCFHHIDFVTSIAFHPRDDRFFLSGSLDGKVRLWNIPEKKVASWTELPDGHLITAVGFASKEGTIVAAGSHRGLCVFYETDGLKYHTQIQVRSTRGRNARGHKITGIQAIPSASFGEDKLLITSNDSRIRLYNMKDKSL
ncbi:WD40-repeat-containing domain protein, partial [Dimargaris cristalligena]